MSSDSDSCRDFLDAPNNYETDQQDGQSQLNFINSIAQQGTWLKFIKKISTESLRILFLKSDKFAELSDLNWLNFTWVLL